MNSVPPLTFSVPIVLEPPFRFVVPVLFAKLATLTLPLTVSVPPPALVSPKLAPVMVLPIVSTDSPLAAQLCDASSVIGALMVALELAVIPPLVVIPTTLRD